MAKRSYTKIAEHFGTDEESVKDYEYQPGRFSRPVFNMTGNEYWAAGPRPPKDHDKLMVGWVSVISSYDGSQLWKLET